MIRFGPYNNWSLFYPIRRFLRWLSYTAGLIVSHLQLLFVVVVVLTNHTKPCWLTCDPAWRAGGEYIITMVVSYMYHITA